MCYILWIFLKNPCFYFPFLIKNPSPNSSLMIFPLENSILLSILQAEAAVLFTFQLAHLVPQPCQTPRVMSLVMTIHQLQRWWYNRGFLRGVVIIGDRNLLLWQHCRLVLWQWTVFGTCHVFSSVRGLLTFSIIVSWHVYLFCTFMMGRSLLQGWILCYLQRWLQRLPAYRM